MIWALPGVVAFLAAVALFFRVRAVAGDAEDLAREISRFSEVRKPLLELRAEALALHADALEIRARPRGLATAPLPARPELGPAS